MSFIIQGIDLPNSGQIELIIRPHGKVLSKTRGISAEAIQIPKGHGRLIDADAIIKAELYDSENGTYIEKEMTIEQWFMFMKNDAPTILESEEG